MDPLLLLVIAIIAHQIAQAIVDWINQ